MRPIDADALPIKFDGHSVSVWEVDLENAPTLDVAPIVHAHWEQGDGEWSNVLGEYCFHPTYICSNCREEEKRNSAFCPNCGATMDGENDESN